MVVPWGAQSTLMSRFKGSVMGHRGPIQVPKAVHKLPCVETLRVNNPNPFDLNYTYFRRHMYSFLRRNGRLAWGLSTRRSKSGR